MKVQLDELQSQQKRLTIVKIEYIVFNVDDDDYDDNDIVV